MGGFGALDLARLAPSRFCAVGAHSAALWFSGGETPAGAFDAAADFERHDLIRFAGERRLTRNADDQATPDETSLERQAPAARLRRFQGARKDVLARVERSGLRQPGGE
jgi:hypothetical protein